MSWLGLVLAYLIGAIPVGFLVARALGGVDIRKSGSGNIGMTNVLRTLGRLPAVLTLLGDVAKGYLAARAARALGAGPGWEAAGAALAIVGNCWPVYLGFRGGKGVAAGLGAFLAVAPWATGAAGAAWVLLAAATRYASVASLAAAASLLLAVWLLGYPWSAVAAAAVAAAIITLRHRENIERLVRGTERRLGERASPA